MRCAVRLLPLLCAALLAAAPQTVRTAPAAAAAAAGSPAPITFGSQLGGRLKDVSIDGNLAYLLEGRCLSVLDISDPAAARVLSRTSTPGVAERVIARDGFAYLYRHDQRWIYDARDPSHPRLVGQQALDPDKWAHKTVVVAMAGATLIQAVWEGLQLWDLQSPGSPELVGHLPHMSNVFAVSGPLIYGVTSSDQIQVWDISNARAPVQRAAINLQRSDVVLRYRDITLDQDTGRLYLALSREVFYKVEKLVMVFDLRDLSQPAMLWELWIDTGHVSVVEGNLVTMSDRMLRVYDVSNLARPTVLFSMELYLDAHQVIGPRFYAQSHTGLRIFDLDRTGAARLIGQYRSPLNAVHEVRLVGQRLYAYVFDGLDVLDVSDPANPTFLAYVRAGQVPYIDDARLLVRDADQLELIDASDPQMPVRAVFPQGRYGTIDGNYAYILASSGLQIFDIGDLSSPVLLGSASFQPVWEHNAQVLVASGRAYIVMYEYPCVGSCRGNYIDIQVVDVSDPQNPRAGGNLRGVPAPWKIQMAAVGTVLWLSVDPLLIVDASNVDAPTLGSYHTSTEHIYDYQIVGDRAYVVDEFSFSVLDLADPLHPSLKTRWRLRYPGYRVRVDGGRAYVFSDRLRLFDIRSPYSPLPLTVAENRAVSMAAAGDYIYLAMSEDGLLLGQIHPERFPQPVLLPLVRKGI